MPIIKAIPKPYKEGFQKIDEVDEGYFNSITDALDFFPLNSSLIGLINKIYELTKIPIGDLQKIFFSVGSLIPYINTRESIKEIVDDIFDIGVREELIKKDNESFKDRLILLLNDKHIYYASKSNSLKTEHGNVLIDSKIVTDLRPVFDIEIEETPKAALIIHNLHIHYQADEEASHKDIFLALDSNDINELQAAIERAKIKENSIKAMLKKADVINLAE